MKILFGPAGSAGLGNEEGVKHTKELGLEAMEVEFTYGVRMSNSDAKKVGEIAKKLGIKLSVHAPYYINLASKEKAKIEASKKRILQSCERAHYLNASPVVFHAGFYQGREKEEVYNLIKKEIIDLQKTIKQGLILY
jgi:deoxyribonuclease-4